ncbi:MAG: alpha/beta hydrolase, partial [Proteobacteria bacterium]|nr:alpha/beta hydrolase [Pseudomonadota bacterium]
MRARQQTWEVHGLRLEGLCWGDESLPPLLALHGWLDNAASFEMLAPLLRSHYVVALDLTGHGRSSRRSEDATYQIWDDLPEVMAVLDQLGWQQFDLIGHSRGAIISTILASAIPERINHLVLLDAVMPQAIPEEDFPRQLAKFLQDKPRRLNREARVYPSAQEAIAARSKMGLSPVAAKALARRSLVERPDGFVWASDP